MRSDRLEPRLEEAQVPGLESHAQAASLLTPIVDVQNRLCNHIHMGLGVNAPRNGEADKLEFWMVVFPRRGVTSG